MKFIGRDRGGMARQCGEVDDEQKWKWWRTTLDMNRNDFCKMIINEDADGDNDYTIRNML